MKSYYWVFDFLLAGAVATITYVVSTFSTYQFETDFYYDLVLLIFICTSILLIVLFLYKIRHTVHCEEPYKIPWTSFISMIVLSGSVALGFTYHFIFKIAYRECPYVEIEDGEWNEFIVKSLQRIGTVTLTILTVVYLLKRAYFGILGTKFDAFTRFMLNSTLILFRLDCFDAKIYHTIAHICEARTMVSSALTIFCPHYDDYNATEIENNICNETTEKEHAWITMDKNLLLPATLSLATEMIPVLMVVHWFVCGYGEQKAELLAKRIKVGSVLQVPPFILSMVSQESPSSAGSIVEIPKWVQIALKQLAILLISLGLTHWLISFYMFLRTYDMNIHTGFGTFDMRLQKVDICMGKLLSAFVQITMRIMIFNWTRKIPCTSLDINFLADSTADKFVIYSSVPFLIPAVLARIAMRIYYYTTLQNGIYYWPVFNAISNLGLVLNICSKCLEALALHKLLALPKQVLHKYKHFFPLLIIANIVINFCDFFGTYFSLNEISQQIEQFIEIFREHAGNGGVRRTTEVFLVVGILAKLLTFSNFLFTFSCALAWFEIVLRYRVKRTYDLNGIGMANIVEMNELQQQQQQQQQQQLEDKLDENE